MGNTQSAEAPRRAPHKLTKPRLANNNSSSRSPATPNSASRFSNSYNVGDVSFEILSDRSGGVGTTGKTAFAGELLLRDDDLIGTTTTVSGGEGVKRSGSIFRSRSIGAPRPRRSPRPLAASVASSRLGRTRSMMASPEASLIQPLESSGPLSDKRASMHYDMLSYQAQRLLKSDEQSNVQQVPDQSNDGATQSEDPKSDWQMEQRRPNLTIDTLMAEPESTRVPSPYSPIRRRSITQTPGVATRSQPSLPSPCDKKDFRKSMPVAPVDFAPEAIEVKTQRRMSMPPCPRDFGLAKRVTTPPNNEYRQLGTLEFGSLRIVNGAPDAPNRLDKVEKGCPNTKLQHFGCEEITASPIVAFPGDVSQPKQLGLDEPQSNAMLPDIPSVGYVAMDLDVADTNQTPLESQGYFDSRPGTLETVRETKTPDLFATSPEFSSNEVLDVRLDPNAKANAKAPSTAGKLQRSGTGSSGMTRSDSGFVSLASSQSSRKPLSTNDSGYSSNASLRSMHGVQKLGSDMDSSALPPMELQRSSSTNESIATDAVSTPREGNSKEVTTPRTREQTPNGAPSPSRLRFPMLRKSKTRESLKSRSGSGPQSGHSRAKSADNVYGPSATPVVPGHEVSREPKPGKLHRLLSRSRSKKLSTSYANHDIHETIPAVPNDIEQRLQEHNGKFPTAPKRLTLKAEASKETLQTIVSVESAEVSPIEGPLPNSTPTSEAVSRMSSGRRRSSHNVLPWTTGQRRSMPHKGPRKSDRDAFNEDLTGDDLPGYLLDDDLKLGNRRSLRQSYGHGAFDRAVAAMSNDQPSPGSVRPNRLPARAHAPENRLRSRASVPDFRGTQLSPISPSPDLFPAKKARTPPPVSMRTRGSKGRRSKRPKQIQGSGGGGQPLQRSMSLKVGHERPRMDLIPSRSLILSDIPTSPLVSPDMGLNDRWHDPHPQYQTHMSNAQHGSTSAEPAPRYDTNLGGSGQMPPRPGPGYRRQSSSQRLPPPPSQMQPHDPWLEQRHPQARGARTGPVSANCREARPIVRPGHIL